MKLLHVDASPKSANSGSRALSRFFVDQLRAGLPALSVDYLDLAQEILPPITGLFASATYTPADQRTAEMREALAVSDALCARLLAADALLLAMPMHNWTMPAAFKTFVDTIVRSGLTYIATDDGRFVGTLGGKKVLFLTTRGVDLRPGSPFAAMDALTPALRAAFGFIGVAAPIFVDAQPMQFANEVERAAAVRRAKEDLAALAETWGDIEQQPALSKAG
ncbi:acyl carrier protein phosphodiesterase [Sphingopyxis fribergensis]|uniref:FMN dependent NADH:quinone oxidoreductase n=1 Tax=Sphingopyxis fribergensis TaxID=1515612 RepID=A0A0A7PDN4_9SPHN|nr:NAD(P)H-dependent oxidoreductase [Sphingopyxis fribergensis]AJA08186.1 acyl carrier protein phosphodiesterase [Sphingopyxis fribergensis]